MSKQLVEPGHAELFVSVVLSVGFSRFFGMVSSMSRMPARGMRVMRSFFVMPAFVMLSSFGMVMRSLLVMF